MKKLYLIFCLLLGSPVFVCAQKTDDKLIDVDFQQATISQFVAQIESKTNYTFYYDAAKFDSLRVTLKLNQATVKKVLEDAFANTTYKYSITQQGQVFLTKGVVIQTSLAAGFFNDKKEVQQPANRPTSANTVDYTSTLTEKRVIESTSENKVYEIGLKSAAKGGSVTLAGYVRNVKSGEPVIGASIYNPVTRSGVATDQFGYYSLTMPQGSHTVLVRGLGMRDTRRLIVLNSDGKLNIEMQEQVTTLKEVKISAEKVANVRSTTMGMSKIDIKTIKQIPAVFGEADVLRVVLTLPGVQTVGEASTGFNVRGGSADQNLILLNDATIYNPSHFFGFFSAFDPDIVQDIELYKSSIPEKFGGRLSSILDVTNREGNKKKFTGSAGIGLLTSRLNIEGPIDSNRTSFIFGGRTTYANWLLKQLPNEYKNSRASFYDLSLNISHQINEKNNLYLSSYFSNDSFRLNSDTTYGYGNRNFSLKWKHNYNNKLYSVITGGYDRYQFNINSMLNPINAYKFNFNINQTNFKTDFSYFINPKHTLSFGLNSIYYKLNPGSNSPVGNESLVVGETVPAEQALESALYLGDKYNITENLSVSAGIRFSLFNYLGPQTVNRYAPGLPRTTSNLLDSTTYGSNKFIKTYGGPEIRLSARYILSDDFSVKAGYNTLRQYIHLLSNTTAISPTDVWKLSDPNIKPQLGDQVSLGFYKNFKSNTIETSVEVYYKRLRNYLDYRSGATLVLNQNIETDVLSTRGKAYGAEFLIKKTAGKLNGWMSYTYSRTFLKQDDPNAGELINNGAYYPANYDKPHSFNLTGNYRFTHRYSVSLNSVYSTGRPLTLPVGKFYYAGAERVLYSDRNQYRIPDFFRTDFSVNIEGNHKLKQRFHNSWTFGIYNITGRKNAYSTYFIQEAGRINGYSLSIFAKPIPFVNFNTRF
ncbi:TonB-dependent receptor [Mucilaginibacter aquatilis]|uniref:TonB-dependent receptor plug domain-containing protein n=1 Tax=Mucilaginibacter aquatilis TaxID=1517760 RepID=A0A6I4I6I5_9SPHI|nr:TonB-dependent receptor [Mucilaginibacter aquatilis]MVN90692.1 TonB-dependent receptor plug domain-containing protein [Mucilaginibacter aquatilis]